MIHALVPQMVREVADERCRTMKTKLDQVFEGHTVWREQGMNWQVQASKRLEKIEGKISDESEVS